MVARSMGISSPDLSTALPLLFTVIVIEQAARFYYLGHLGLPFRAFGAVLPACLTHLVTASVFVGCAKRVGADSRRSAVPSRP